MFLRSGCPYPWFLHLSLCFLLCMSASVWLLPFGNLKTSYFYLNRLVKVWYLIDDNVALSCLHLLAAFRRCYIYIYMHLHIQTHIHTQTYTREQTSGLLTDRQCAVSVLIMAELTWGTDGSMELKSLTMAGIWTAAYKLPRYHEPLQRARSPWKGELSMWNAFLRAFMSRGRCKFYPLFHTVTPQMCVKRPIIASVWFDLTLPTSTA